MRDLRERIATVLYHRDGFVGTLAEAADAIRSDCLKGADAVIAELALSRQESHDTWDTMLVDHHRYTTDWINSHE